jgi:hypothetical protein
MTTLLSTSELNKIITAVDSTTSMFKTCDVFGSDVHEAHLLSDTTEYLHRTSTSLTELVRTDIDIDGRPSAFLKIWFSWYKLNIDSITESINVFYREEYSLASTLFGDKDVFIDAIADATSTTSLEYEARVYQYITDNIILKNVSPNFIPILTNNTCTIGMILNSLTKFGDFKRKPDLISKLTRLNDLFPSLELNFIMTGSSKTITSADNFLQLVKYGTYVLPQYEYSSILFQFFYALYVMHVHKIVHNDNHMDNVLIQTLPEEITLDFTIGTFNVRFSTKYIVKFFDWDRAYCEALGENEIIDSLVNVRNVTTFVRGRDFSTFICFLYAVDVPGFNRLMDMFIEGPKPTPNSNNEKITIYNGVTDKLFNWLYKHPKNMDKTWTYLTIPKRELELLVEPSTIDKIRNKLGQDRTGSFIYNNPNITNIYLKLNRNHLIILEGNTCNPMYDSLDLDVERYFKDNTKFSQLCFGLSDLSTRDVYTYTMS